ncbi:MAG: AMP-dependent synthetase/ligase [Spirochaetia bacterium]
MQGLDTVPKRIRSTAGRHPELTALMAKNDQGEFESTSYKALYEQVKQCAAGLAALGITRGDHVGIISDNRKEWIVTDLALLGIGAVDVPRGSDSMADEVGYILGHAECSVSFAENSTQADKILSKKESLPNLQTLILYDDSAPLESEFKDQVKVLSFEVIMASGREEYLKDTDFYDREVDKGSSADLATLIYTSGTTGEPKGVMLTHRSFTFQVERVYDHLHIQPGHVFLSVLPIWHSFERAVEYIVLNIGASIAYSKPIGSVMLPDMQKVQPHWLTSVPRIWEGIRSAIYRNMKKEGGVKLAMFRFFVAVGEMYATFFNMFTGRLPDFTPRYHILDKVVAFIPMLILAPFKFLGFALVFRKIQAKLGGRFIAGISGGGALPTHVDRFFYGAGISLLEGYGLTETGPVLAVRKQKHPVFGTVGPLLKDIEHRVVDAEGVILPEGRKGTLYVKSEQLMQGYYKQPEKTAEVLQDGWLNTGDIAIFTHSGEFKILGRTKETIVLMGGENIEPLPIEDRLNASEAIQQAMVVGQDQKFLAALIVPEMSKIEEFAQSSGITYVDPEELLSNPEIQEYVHNEIQSQVNPKTGFRHFECIFRFKLLPKPFEIGKELTHTLKIRREVVYHEYQHEIDELFK